MNKNQINLDDLPVPNVIEELDFESLYQERKKKLIKLNSVYKDVLELESDPLAIDLQVGAYREFMIRHRINEAAQARLLAKAKKGDLDHLGAFYGVKRDQEEKDDPYRLRIRDRIIGSSTAGSLAHYRTRAMEVNPSAIRDIAIDSPIGGAVRVSILVRSGYCFKRKKPISELSTFNCIDYCTENKTVKNVVDGKCPDFTALSGKLIKEVYDHVNSDSVRMLTDTLSVVPAEQININVKAEISLQPDTPAIVFETIKTNFLRNWENEIKLGWDIAPSWIMSQLHHPGVHHVDLFFPAKTIKIEPNQSAKPGIIELTLKESAF